MLLGCPGSSLILAIYEDVMEGPKERYVFAGFNKKK
jgi:hypothetical protein